jgi:hypothetical protein
MLAMGLKIVVGAVEASRLTGQALADNRADLTDLRLLGPPGG